MEIGRMLNVTEKDIRGMGRKGIARNVINWIIAAIIAILAFVLGFFAGRGGCPADVVTTTTTTTTTTLAGYPFAAALAVPFLLPVKKRGRFVALLISAIVFLVALKSTPVFGQAVLYNVFSKRI